MQHNVYIYIAVITLVTYLLRVLPLTLIRKQIKNTFIRSFLYYIPYTVLSVMTFPAALYATGNVLPACAGVAVAVILALLNKGLTVVAVSSCTVVFLVSQFLC